MIIIIETNHDPLFEDGLVVAVNKIGGLLAKRRKIDTG